MWLICSRTDDRICWQCVSHKQTRNSIWHSYIAQQSQTKNILVSWVILSAVPVQPKQKQKLCHLHKDPWQGGEAGGQETGEETVWRKAHHHEKLGSGQVGTAVWGRGWGGGACVMMPDSSIQMIVICLSWLQLTTVVIKERARSLILKILFGIHKSFALLPTACEANIDPSLRAYRRKFYL